MADPVPVIDDQRANLFHELVLSNRIVENLIKGVDDICGEKAAEQVLQNFVRKEQVDTLLMEETTNGGSSNDQELTLIEQQSKTKAELERLATRLPNTFSKFADVYSTAFGGQLSSIPKNRPSDSNSVTSSVGEEVVEAVEQIASVTEKLTRVCGQSSS